MFKNMRFRYKFMGLGGLFVVLSWILTDPDLGIISQLPIGSSTVAMIIILLKTVLYVGMLHVSRVALFDYLPLQDVINKAMEDAKGAGMVFIGMGLVMVSIALTMMAATTS